MWFLGGKLATYTLLGALLGLLGALAQPSPGARAAIQIATALLMIATALHFLGVHPIFRYAIIQPPRFIVRRIQRGAKSGEAVGPALLGGLTVFLPCGVTQAMQLLAINSGSPAAGAAILAAFVLGTTPLFFSIGYLAMKLGEAAHLRFMRFAAVGILLMAIFTLDAGLRLGRSPVTLAMIKNAIIPVQKPVLAMQTADGVQEARITVDGGGYSPSRVQIKRGKPARITFVSAGVAGCTLALLFEDRQIILPETGETPIELPPQQPGSIKYTCAMGMYGGSVEVI